MTQPVFIIAEAGVNHNGDVELAKKLIDAAKEAGADAVKFQTFKTKSLLTKTAPKADYQRKNTGSKGSQYNMLKKLELSEDDHFNLLSYAREQEIQFMSTPFDTESLHLLHKMGVEIIKVGSGDLTNFLLLREIGKLNKKVILSTGMANMTEVRKSVNTLFRFGTRRGNLTVLHATTEYPAPYEEVNLRAMISMSRELQVRVGYSDHTPGIEIPIAAAALGATVIEKHFTLDRNMKGPDHKASLEPHELSKMVGAIRKIEKALGDGEKKPSAGEKKNIPIARKSIVAACSIKKGDIFTEKNLTIKRPGTGSDPMKWEDIIGEKATRNYEPDDLI